jgi:hypothetical protein
MANQALQMLVVAAISWLLVGQSQAAGPTRREPAPHHNDEILTQEQLLDRCVVAAANALNLVHVPGIISEYVQLSRLILPNIFDAYGNQGVRRQYYSRTQFVGPRGTAAVAACRNFIPLVEGQFQQQDAACEAPTFIHVLGDRYDAILSSGGVSLMPRAEAAMICYMMLRMM